MVIIISGNCVWSSVEVVLVSCLYTILTYLFQIQGVLADMIIDEEDHEPASTHRQREILGRLEPDPPVLLLKRYHKAYHTYFGNRQPREPPKGILSPRAIGFPWGLDDPPVMTARASTSMSRVGSVSARSVKVRVGSRATTGVSTDRTRTSSRATTGVSTDTTRASSRADKRHAGSDGNTI